MKYRANSQDTWHDYNIKALDSMPIGTQVEFTGSTIPTGWEEVNDYSTTEVNTGKTWIDGKPIYRKTMNIQASTTAQNFAVSTIASNIDKIWIDASASYYGYGGIISDWEVSGGRFRITIDSGNVYYISSTAGYGAGTITFNYTKTTD